MTDDDTIPPCFPRYTGSTKDFNISAEDLAEIEDYDISTEAAEAFQRQRMEQLEAVYRAGVRVGADKLLDELVVELLEERDELSERIAALQDEDSDAASGDLENARGQRMQLVSILQYLESRGYDIPDNTSDMNNESWR